MAVPCIVLVNGFPGVGKTTLAKQLASDLHVPVVFRDSLKEFLHDAMAADRDTWSDVQGRVASYAVYRMFQEAAELGLSVIIESAFIPKYAVLEMQAAAADSKSQIIEVYCHCDEAVRRQRWQRRTLSGERHQVHLDQADSFGVDKYGPLRLGPVIEYDTADATAYPILLESLTDSTEQEHA